MVFPGSHLRIEAITGKWHLLDGAADEIDIPMHRVDLMFHSDAGQFRGAILNRLNGKEIPLASLQFDGLTLELQMQATDGKTQAEMPILVMRAANVKFEGYWMKSATESLGPKLKLLRAKA